MSNNRAVRYRRLALAEPGPEKSKLFYLIADEADGSVLVTAKRKIPAEMITEASKTGNSSPKKLLCSFVDRLLVK